MGEEMIIFSLVGSQKRKAKAEQHGRTLRSVNAPPAELEASGSPIEGDEDNFLDHLKPKFEYRIFNGFAVFSPGR
jgi:hypothetical protein